MQTAITNDERESALTSYRSALDNKKKELKSLAEDTRVGLDEFRAAIAEYRVIETLLHCAEKGAPTPELQHILYNVFSQNPDNVEGMLADETRDMLEKMIEATQVTDEEVQQFMESI